MMVDTDSYDIISDSIKIKTLQTEAAAAVFVDPLDEFSAEAWRMANLLHDDFNDQLDLSPIGQYSDEESPVDEFDAAPVTIIAENDEATYEDKVEWKNYPKRFDQAFVPHDLPI